VNTHWLPEGPPLIVDVHAHGVPVEELRDTEEEWIVIEADDRGESVLVDGHRLGPIPPLMSDTARRLGAMDRQGIDLQLVSPWVGLFGYHLPPDLGLGLARVVNDSLVVSVSRHPARLRAMATVPLQDVNASAVELERAITALGMAGVQIGPTVGGHYVSEGLDTFWETAARLGCLVLVHPGLPLPGIDLSRYFLDNLVGRPAETAIAGGHLILSGLLDRYPGLNVCLVHGGGFLPYQIGRFDWAFGRQLAGDSTPTLPSISLRRLYYDSILHSPASLGFLIETVGPTQVLLGSDYPFAMGDDDPVKHVKSARIDKRSVDLILGENVEPLIARPG
jgi:aminocarboxymuconate-semialdehyde decarboxylase